MKLKDTLCLPKPEFPMKGSLPQREPERLERWERDALWERVTRARAGRPKYVLHDGPPYANGHLHLGTALNKILKDFVLKSRSQAGFDTPYVPGWDCHGMPIELHILKRAREAGENLSVREIRRQCREFAEAHVEIQRTEFKRLGVLGDWADPYLTLDPVYEAAIIGAFRVLHEKGYIYKGLRSIHWCPSCRTALANAEVEHDPAHESPAIHVRFPVPPSERAAKLGLPEGAAVLIWTTTPWTIPANVATALHPGLEYVLVGGDARHSLVAAALLPRVAKELGWTDFPVLASWTGTALDGLVTRHPLFPRDSPVVMAEYVTTEAGTGCVHTAPGHGADDFQTGQRYGLPILVPVDKGGVFTDEAGPYAGLHVFDSNERVIADLLAAGALAARANVVHSYPTCWRCRGPVIFLATDQWFLDVEHDNLRAACLAEVEATTWVPAWGRDRMRDSVQTRPDWCLSRQRAWGVPIPAFACRKCASPVISSEIIASIEKAVREAGSEIWFEKGASELAPPGTRCPKCGSEDLENDPNILDVWFDASCSHDAVLASGRWAGVSWPADLYVEAVDQHRGWFQVSLLNSVATKGQAPYHAVFTHGLILDEKGRKMSKSLGNVVSPEEILSKHGADVLRLLFASVDVTSDIRFSQAMVEPVSEAYRKVRNTLRFLLGNLAGFDPDTSSVAEPELEALDRHALERLRQVSGECRDAYGALDFVRVYRMLVAYLTTDVSAFYAHVLKDRLYCDAPTGVSRRSAQTVLFAIARECCGLLAPFACFTADEVWEHLPAWKGKTGSVHESTWIPLVSANEVELGAFGRLLAVRDDVLKALELLRAAGTIGDPLEAEIDLAVDEQSSAVLMPRKSLLAAVFMVAEVRLHPTGTAVPEGAHAMDRMPGGWVQARRTTATKCPRCWQHRQDGGRLPGHPDVCARCAEVVAALGVEIDPA